MRSRHDNHRLTGLYEAAGVLFSLAPPSSKRWWGDRSSLVPADQPLAAYLTQLVEESVATEQPTGVLIPWDAMYALRDDPVHAGSAELLRLPSTSDWVPRLETQGALSDPSFELVISAWYSPTKGTVTLARKGAVVGDGKNQWLLTQACWHLASAVVDLATRSSAITYAERLRAVGHLCNQAKVCGALLDDYLTHTSICTPTALRLGLKRETALGKAVIEVVPQPDGAPENFIDAFDRYANVQPRYDLPQPDGSLTHVAPDAAVADALVAIKRLPGRRLSGEQASLFTLNPFAILGSEAAKAIDEEQLNIARDEAGLTAKHLRFLEAASSSKHAAIELTSVSADGAAEAYELNETQLGQLCDAAARSRARSLPLFAWADNEILLDAVTEDQLTALMHWRAHMLANASAGLAGTLLDLSAYSPRVLGFDAKVQAVPYVAHQTQGKSWLPDDDIGIATVDTRTGATQRHRMTPERIDALQRAIDAATQRNEATVRVPGSNTDITLAQAENLVSGLRDIGLNGNKPPTPRPVSDPAPDQRVGLRIHHNIESLDYVVTARQLVGNADSADAALPDSLNPGVTPLPHQRYALAWLQRRYRARKDGVAGCLLADDMGLGKTLESLMLIAWAGEQSRFERPSLVVAPVSLLDNWKSEVAKFLNWPEGSVLSLYGRALSALRVPPDQIGGDLGSMGVRKLLCPEFGCGFRLVLTTYETLRDYQLSIARQRWDVVVCDEAQKIKNPRAFVTQAAKALQANFKIACTGTPVENSLADLWCLFDFFQPGCLGALNEFTKAYRASIEAHQDGYEALVERLRIVIDPWVLRRLKTEVGGGLPQKLTGDQADPSAGKLPMSAQQLVEYTKAVSLYRAAREQPGPQRGNAMLSLLQQLRMICAYPMGSAGLASELAPVAEHLRVSPKLAWLVKRLGAIAENGEKAIVFTDYRAVQRLIQRTIEDQFGVRPSIINGATATDPANGASRQRLIDAFQQVAGFGVIILGTTAVGFGVNIQQANHVIHFTRSWNPAKEDQATDRAYRIGQTRDVYVYCPTVAGPDFESFEQRLGDRLDYKRSLATDMLAGQQEVTLDDLADL